MKFLFVALIFFVTFINVATAAPLVIGKRYPLNTKAQRGTLVWQFIVFQRSITGGVQVNLEVYNNRAVSIGYFDEYRKIVDDKIQQNTISKFSMRSASVNFSSDRYADISFQVPKLDHLYYLPLRVEYKDGFEDYLVRLRLANGKLSIASRLLQHGKVVDPNAATVEEKALENKKDKEEVKAKEDESLESNIDENKDESLESLPGLEKQDTPSLNNEEVKAEEIDPSLLAPLQQEAPSEELSEMLGNEKDEPNYQDPSDIQFDLPAIDDKKEEESDQTQELESTPNEPVDTENTTEDTIKE